MPVTDGSNNSNNGGNSNTNNNNDDDEGLTMTGSAQQPKLTRSMSRRFYRFESLAEKLAEVVGGQQSDPNLWVFEVAWEVANKGK